MNIHKNREKERERKRVHRLYEVENVFLNPCNK